MNCYQHPDAAASAYCRSCGRALCTSCQHLADGTVYCAEHAPASASANPYAAPNPIANPYMAPPPPVTPVAAVQSSPGLAFLLGLIPGVGAIYNGQYVKGLLHAVIFGLLVSITNSADRTSGHDFLFICSMAFFCYMPFEAFHTARKRQLGMAVDEWSSLIATNGLSSRVPVAPIVLIVIGVLFLMQSLHVLDFQVIGRFWPVLLVVIGAIMLYGRLRRPTRTVLNGHPGMAETSHER